MGRRLPEPTGNGMDASRRTGPRGRMRTGPRHTVRLLAAALYIAALPVTAATHAQTAPSPVANAAAPATGQSAAAARGAALFSGRARLQNGGPPCAACHSVAGQNPLGGGSMGRDLTTAYDRLGQDAGLKATLGNIAFPTMRQAFAGKPLTTSEIDDLTAYLKISASTARAAGTAPADPGRFGFNWLWLFAVLGAAALNALLLIWWPRQRESVGERLRRTGRSWRRPGLGGSRR